MDNVKRTTHLSTNSGRGCEHCGDGVGSLDEDIAHSINHYIDKHGYRLLHVGTESSRDNEGQLWHHTVAVLGHDNPPAVMPPPKIEFKIPQDMQEPRAGTAPTIHGTPKSK